MKPKKNKLVCIVLLSGMLLLTQSVSAQSIQGNGNIQTQSREAENFNQVHSAGPFDISLTQGHTTSIKLEGDENILPYIITDVRGNTLVLKTKKGINLQPSHKITVEVTVKNLEEVKMSGAGDLKSTNKLLSGHLYIKVSGSGNIDLTLKTNAFRMDIAGTTKATLKGNSIQTEYVISGTADINADDMVADIANIAISGVGKAHVNAQKTLDISISGVGKIWYKGNPAISQSVSGTGSIKKE